jgi:hypothetical protein
MPPNEAKLQRKLLTRAAAERRETLAKVASTGTGDVVAVARRLSTRNGPGARAGGARALSR